jgi:hypothetical protein
MREIKSGTHIPHSINDRDRSLIKERTVQEAYKEENFYLPDHHPRCLPSVISRLELEFDACSLLEAFK